MRILMLAAAALLLCPNAVYAADWARGMFSTTNHEFGTVARSAKTEYRFEFENRSNQEVHVRSVRASCGCTTPIIETKIVKPGQTGAILARFNTDTFTGQRQATLTVTFEKPQFSEVQLQVKGYIRSDIVFNPGEASFGTVNEGAEKSLSIDLDYAGRADWKVVEVKSNDNFVNVASTEISRVGNRIKYRLDVELKGNAPSGALQSELIIKTNDMRMTSVPLRLLANVQPTIAVSPQLVSLGQVKQGEQTKQILVLKGAEPFRIMEINSQDFDVKFEASEESKALHTLPLTLSPLGAQGQIKGKILVKTDLHGESTVSLDATCQILDK